MDNQDYTDGDEDYDRGADGEGPVKGETNTHSAVVTGWRLCTGISQGSWGAYWMAG